MSTATASTPQVHSLSQPAQQSVSAINVGDKERMYSVLAGGALGMYGLSRFSLGGLAIAAVGGSLLYRGITGHCSLYQTLGVNTVAPRGRATSVRAGHGIKVEQSILVNRHAATLWRFWRKLENVGRIMQHLECVTEHEDGRSHWTARAPLGYKLHWQAEIINEKENELIAWRSVEGSAVDSAGSVHFRELPNRRGTEVRVVLKYDAHAAQPARLLAWIMGAAPEQQIREDLRRFKQIMETGEAATTQGQPRGQCQ